MSPAESQDPVDQIADALMRMRGRRGRMHEHHGHAHSGRDHRAHDHRAHAPGHIGGGPARVRMLEALAAADQPLTVTQIAEAVGVDQPRASRLIAQSVQLELVQREPDPDDARRTRVVLTDAGRNAASGFRGRRREMIRAALEGLDAQERADFVRLLQKFADAWPQADSDR